MKKRKSKRGLKPALKKKITRHLKQDMRDFEHEKKEDASLLKKLGSKKKRDPKKSAKKAKFKKVMHEFKAGTLHSGSKNGPQVKNPKQAVAIAFSEARKMKKKQK